MTCHHSLFKMETQKCSFQEQRALCLSLGRAPGSPLQITKEALCCLLRHHYEGLKYSVRSQQVHQLIVWLLSSWFRFLCHIPQRIASQLRAVSVMFWSSGLELTADHLNDSLCMNVIHVHDNDTYFHFYFCYSSSF